MKNLILIGAGGHCRSIIEGVESQGEYRIIGILDKNLPKDSLVYNYPVLGSDNLIEDLAKADNYFIIAIGHIKDNSARVELFKRIKKAGGKFANIIASTSKVSKHSNIGEGNVILHLSLINAGVSIGNNCIVNSAALIEHDAIIGDNCHISTGAIINGSTQIGNDCFIGSNSVINHQLTIGDGSVIASGSLVTKNLKGMKTYLGNPVKVDE